jgi:hypothetical protein
MSEIDTLLFCDPDFVGQEPKIDGFFDLDYMLTGEAPESGYLGGSELTIGNSGIAPVVFRGVRRTSVNRLVLAFMCRFSHSFDADNAVVIVLKPTFTDADPTHTRKIVIKPVSAGIGAGPGTGTGGNQIKNDKGPADVDYFMGVAPLQPGDPPTWSQYFTQINTTIKVRSWLPSVPPGTPEESAWSIEVELPISAADGGGDWIDLSDDFGLFFSVIKIVPVDGGAATQYWFPAVTGADVTGIVDLWTPSLYGHGIIPHQSGQSLPANLYPGVGFDDPWLGIGCRPKTDPDGSPLGSTINGAASPAGTPDNRIVAKVRNNGATPANDITCEFRFHRYGLGPADPLLWNSPPGLDPNPAPNRPTQPAFNVPANSTGNEVFADWPTNDPSLAAVASQDTCMWAQLSARTPVTFFQSSTRRNMTFVNLSESESEAVVSGKGYEDPPDGGSNQDFIIETFCRGVIVQELIDKRDQIDPALMPIVAQSLQGAIHPQINSDIMITHATLGRGAGATAASAYADSVVFIWQSFGYRVTANTITLGKTTYPLLDNGCGSFGAVAHHVGVQDSFGWTFEADGMVRYRPGLYGLKVPNGGEKVIKMRLTAAPDGPRGDSASKLPQGKFTPPTRMDEHGGGKPKPGCLGVLFAVFAGAPLLMRLLA